MTSEDFFHFEISQNRHPYNQRGDLHKQDGLLVVSSITSSKSGFGTHYQLVCCLRIGALLKGSTKEDLGTSY